MAEILKHELITDMIEFAGQLTILMSKAEKIEDDQMVEALQASQEALMEYLYAEGVVI